MTLNSLQASDNLIEDLRAIDLLWNPAPSPYVDKPVEYIQKEMHEELWSIQREILQSVNDNRYTTVRSCHGPGKSFLASRLAVWWLAVKPDPFVVTSAPTSHQVRTVLWRYIRQAKKAAPSEDVPGVISQGQVPEWKQNGELVAFGRKPADYLDPIEAAAAFQGIHAQHVLVILDEGSGIPEWLANACETLITNDASRLLVIGNPDNPVSWFKNTFKPNSGYVQFKIAADDTPNFTGEKVSQRMKEQLTSKIWVEERKKRWGVNSPLYKSKVDAEFPETADDVVFTPQHIQIAVINDRSSLALKTQPEDERAGFDVARLGPDESVIYTNRRGYVRLQWKWAKLDTMRSVGEFRRTFKEHRTLVPVTNVDVVGIGSGVYDRLKELHYPVVPFNGGEKAFNPERFKNRRSEAYWEAREMCEQGLIDIDPEDLDLQAELMEHKYKHTSTGQIQLEPKEDVAARLGRSPDRADAFIMSLQKQASMQTYEDLANRPTPDQLQDNARTDEDIAPTEFEPGDLVGDLLDVQF
jgi:hypothetical protein